MSSDPDDDDLPNLNTGQPWSENDVRDLRAAIENGDLLHEIANYLCRTKREVREKARELGLRINGE
jgi:hypothetical protein